MQKRLYDVLSLLSFNQPNTCKQPAPKSKKQKWPTSPEALEVAP